MENVVQQKLAFPKQSDAVVGPYTALRARLAAVDADTVDEGGNTMLHLLAEYQGVPTPVYILSDHGVLINHLNKEGESALHLAVRANNSQIVEALLQCGADANITNKLGVSPAALCATSDLKALVSRFQPGLCQAVTTGDFGSVCRLLRSWVSVTAMSLANGQSVSDLTKSCLSNDVYVRKCLQKIRDSETQSRLVGAVLADDVNSAQEIIANSRMRTVNCRYKKGERNLLSVAIENKSPGMVKVLLEDGVKTNCRVRHRMLPVTDVVPCVLMAFSREPDLRVAQLMWDCGIHGLHGRDKEGNTALIRAVMQGASLSFIQWYVEATQGKMIAKRNAEKLTAVQVAEKHDRADVISFLNEYIEENFERLGVELMSQFYGPMHPKLAGLYEKVEKNGVELLQATCKGDLRAVAAYNKFNYQDRNGYTALHKAVAACCLSVIQEIVQSRPVLKGISDNCGRYPLHLAFLLPEGAARQDILSFLLQSNAESYEYTSDKDGLYPAEYPKLDQQVKQAILDEVVTASCY